MASNFEVKTGAALMFNTLINYLLTTDDVEGDPADITDGSLLAGKINIVLQAFFDNLNYLKTELESGATIVDASETAKGIAELANQTEGRSGTDNERIMTSLRVLDFLRNGTGVIASETRKGTLEIADETQRRAGSSNALAMTPSGMLDAFRNGSAFKASESRFGAVERANQSEGRGGSDTEKYMTSQRTLDAIRSGTDFSATASVKGAVQRATTSTSDTNDTLYITKAIAKAMIEELAPMLKVYSGSANATQFTDSNNNNIRVLVNQGNFDLFTPGLSKNLDNHILIPTGETLMGGIGGESSGADPATVSYYPVEGNRIGVNGSNATTAFVLFVSA